MNQFKKILMIVFIIILLLALFYFKTNTPKQQTQTTETAQIYTSKEYDLSFAIPEGWHIGDSRLENGTLQIFNYDESDIKYAKGGGFKRFPLINKIEITIRDSYDYSSPDESLSKLKLNEEIEINKLKWTKQSIELTDSTPGTPLVVYITTLPKTNGEYLVLTIYGNPDNFHVLDDLVRNIIWAPKTP